MIHQGKDDSGLQRGSPKQKGAEAAGQEEGDEGAARPCRRSQTSGSAAFPIKENPQEEQFTSSLAYNIIFALGL